MINKWDDDINRAITKVGGDTSGSEGLPDYAEIIETQLVSNEAVGKGIYQDFLFVDDQNETSNYPWDGEPTTSTNVVQASSIANSIKQLYDTMASTERFNVLLVDEIPKTEINLSAVYLLRAKCCDDPDCVCPPKENTYTGCYFVKAGKKIKRVDIPEFKVNLDELFFLTRAEYDASLSDYVQTIEDMLRKKFGKYWNDEGFALDETIDQIVLDIKAELKEESDKILAAVDAKVNEVLIDINTALEEVNTKVQNVETELNNKFEELEESVNNSLTEVKDSLNDVNNRFEEVKTDLQNQFDNLENSINASLNDVNEKVDEKLIEVDNKVEQIEKQLEDQLDEFEQNVNNDLAEIREDVEERVKITDLVSLDEEINELK